MRALLQPGKRPALSVLILAAFFSWTGAFAQQIRLMPVRSAPLGSPAGTVGDPVTAEYNLELRCWEYRFAAGGIEVDLELQANGWGNAAGSPTLGVIQGTISPASYANGQGGELNPKGWPASPGDGAYQPRMRCEGGGDLRPCSPPFDPTCDNGNNGVCVLASNWVMPDCANDLAAIATPTLAYGWATAAQVDCNIDDGSHKTLGGLILEVPINASGTYVITLDPDPNYSLMITGTGLPFPYVNLTHACITVETGNCCSNIGPNQVCEDLSFEQCELRPGPRWWVAGRTCETCGCPGHCGSYGPDFCDDFNPCTDEFCEPSCGNCQYPPSYDEATQCCDPSNGNITPLEDGTACTVGSCNPATGEVTQGPNPDCVIYDPDAYPKNRYVSFETGVLPVDVAFHVRMTASWHFPSSVGDLGWVGVPDGEGTALVVPDPVFLPSWPAMVRLSDCQIAPGSWYEIRATGDGVNFDPPIVVQTTAAPGPKFWGDIVGDFNGLAWEPPNGVQNFGDVQAAIKTWQGGASAAPLIWADVEPEVVNRTVNFNDVHQLLLAFTGEPYPFADPGDCP